MRPKLFSFLEFAEMRILTIAFLMNIVLVKDLSTPPLPRAPRCAEGTDRGRIATRVMPRCILFLLPSHTLKRATCKHSPIVINPDAPSQRLLCASEFSAAEFQDFIRRCKYPRSTV